MDYLDGRQQFVHYSGVSSATRNISCGVPHSSVLGPLLFNIYLTSLHSVISSHGIDHISYADDVQLLLSTSISDLPAALCKLEDCIADVKDFFSSSLLTLNDSKTEFIILGSSPILRKLPSVSIKVGMTSINPSSCVRNLGVLIDSSLSFRDHIKATCSRSFMALRLISRIKRCITKHHCCLMINALVLSNIDYCSSLLYNIPLVSCAKLQRIINASFRLLHGIKKSNSCCDLLRKQGWLNVQERNHLRYASIIFGVLMRKQPSYLHNQLSFPSYSHELRSVTQKLLSTVSSHTAIGARSFRCTAPNVWNKLPADVRTSRTVSTFQTRLKKHLLLMTNI